MTNIPSKKINLDSDKQDMEKNEGKSANMDDIKISLDVSSNPVLQTKTEAEKLFAETDLGPQELKEKLIHLSNLETETADHNYIVPVIKNTNKTKGNFFGLRFWYILFSVFLIGYTVFYFIAFQPFIFDNVYYSYSSQALDTNNKIQEYLAEKQTLVEQLTSEEEINIINSGCISTERINISQELREQLENQSRFPTFNISNPVNSYNLVFDYTPFTDLNLTYSKYLQQSDSELSQVTNQLKYYKNYIALKNFVIDECTNLQSGELVFKNFADISAYCIARTDKINGILDFNSIATGNIADQIKTQFQEQIKICQGLTNTSSVVINFTRIFNTTQSNLLQSNLNFVEVKNQFSLFKQSLSNRNNIHYTSLTDTHKNQKTNPFFLIDLKLKLN
jgi:hypothetical protein